MNELRFDTWTRRQFGGVAGAAVLAVAGVVPAAVSARRPCPKRKKRCGGRCIRGQCCGGERCPRACQCTKTVAQQQFCKPNNQALSIICTFGACPVCFSSSDCTDGFRCVEDATFGAVKLCQPPCGFET